MAAVEHAVLGDDEIARTHPVNLWRPDGPAAALVLLADGEGVEHWAGVVDGVALVGIESHGVPYDPDVPYDQAADPRARAYLEHVDPPYFERHLAYTLDVVLPWARERVGDLPVIAFGCSNGAAWATAAARARPDVVAGVLAFSLGVAPRARRGMPPHALVAGRREPGFLRTTTRYARALRLRGVRVRLRRPDAGHDHELWAAELAPALAWALARARR